MSEIAQVKTTRTLRPSFANLAAKCVAAAHGEGDRFVINWEGGAAGRVGSALHVAAKALVLREQIPLDEIYCRYGLTVSEQRDLRMLIACVRKYCLEQLHAGGWSEALVAEQRLEGLFETATVIYDMGGTMDVGGLNSDGQIWGTIDWKTTRLENADYAPQQMIYLWLAKEWIQKNLPQTQWPKFYQYHIVFVRDWSEEVSEAYTAEQLDKRLARFVDSIESWDGREYHPGGACIYCPRQADCPAVYALVTAMSRALADPQFKPTAEQADDEELVNLKVKATAVTNLLGNAMELLKAIVVGRGGEISSPQGVLTITHRPSYTIDALKAWPICEAELTTQELAAATRLSKTTLLDGVANHYGRGLKKKGKDEFWARLEDVEAVEQSDSLVLLLKKAKLIDDKNFQN